MKKHKLFNKTVFNKSNTRTIPVHAAMTVSLPSCSVLARVFCLIHKYSVHRMNTSQTIYTYNPFSKADDRITLNINRLRYYR